MIWEVNYLNSRIWISKFKCWWKTKKICFSVSFESSTRYSFFGKSDKNVERIYSTQKKSTQTTWFLSSITWKKSSLVTFYSDLNRSFSPKVPIPQKACTSQPGWGIFILDTKLIIRLELWTTTTTNKPGPMDRGKDSPRSNNCQKSSTQAEPVPLPLHDHCCTNWHCHCNWPHLLQLPIWS